MKLNKLIIVLMLLVLITAINAQVSQGGEPHSFYSELRSEVPFETMREVDTEALIAEDEIDAQYKDVPWRFGDNIYVDYDLTNSGVWDVLSNGDKIWRLGISSPGAYTINLTFDNYQLPENAELFVYNEDHSHIIGSFTNYNNREDHAFATTLVKGDKIVIEYFEPESVEFKGEIEIEIITHGYRDAYGYTRSFGSSGSCNMNVICPDGDPWENEIRSAVMLVSGSNGFCSGALVNNTSEDGVPYILTANHCYSDPSSWIFWFNWQSDTCANPGSSPSYDSMSGATLKSSNDDSDFCLVELGSTPPPSYEVFYSGWNRQDVASTSSVGIHHPSGDIKKISFDDDPSVTSDYDPSPYLANSHWEITQWDRSTTTEGGSSGSPLYDQNRRIIGQLHGGWASCTSLTQDYYGKFSMSWDRGGSSSNQLVNWLDPTGIAGLTLNGYDPNSAPEPPVANFSANDTSPAVGQTVNFNDLSSNSPHTWFWTFDPSTVTYVGGTDSSSENPEVQFNDETQYTVTLYVVNDYGNDTEIKSNYINAVQMYNLFEDNFETDTGWILAGEFERGAPTGLGGNYGNPDPTSAHSGTNVLGVDLTGLGTYPGDYETNLGDRAYTATSPVIDCSGNTNIEMSFWRYLNVETSTYDHAYIDITTDGSNWTNLWENSGGIEESDWSEQNIDISSIADGQASVQIRFCIGTTDGSWQYSGWNIDDLVISGAGGAPTPSITVTSPNGGEDWDLGSTHNITWSSFGTSGNVMIELYENGSFYNTITSNTIDDGSYSWVIPGAYNAGTQYTIKIEDVNTPSLYDFSDTDFTISIVTEPDITYAPASFNKTLAPEATISDGLTIGNEGTATLDYTATVSYTGRNITTYTSEFEVVGSNISFTNKKAPIQYDPSNYPTPRQGGDTVAEAVVISSLPYNNTGTTVGYVNDYDEVCDYSGSTSPDVVYSYTPAANIINGFVSLCGDTDYDSKLYIYENTVTPGSSFACNDDTCVSALGQSYVSELTDLTFTVGNTYYIVIDGYGGASGNYEIDITGDVDMSWLTLEGLNEVTGSINSGSANVITVGFDATGLAVGIYNANITITSNDPDEATIIVPVTLTISEQQNYPEWEVTNYPNNSATLYGYVTISEFPAEAGDIVGAFSSGECRSIGDIQMDSGIAYITLVIQLAANGDPLYFQVYDYSADQVYNVQYTTEADFGEIIGTYPTDLVHINAGDFLPTPINIQISNVGMEITISWDAVGGATSYTVYRSSDPYAEFPGDWTSETGITGTTWSYTTDKMKRFYRVTANN